MRQSILILPVLALMAASVQAQTGQRQLPASNPKAKYGKGLVQPMVPPSAPLVGGADSCVTPDVLVGSGNFGFDNTLATRGTEGQNESACLQFGFTSINADVWFTWTAPLTGNATITTCNITTIDTKIAVYTGTTCPTGAAIACNDDNCGGTFQTSLSFACTSGTSYVIQLGNSDAPPPATPGAGVFSLTASLPATNDDCSTPVLVVGNGPFPFDNSQATTSAQGQSSCTFFGSAAIPKDVWFTWQATFTGTAGVRTCGQTGVDTKIAVYSGAGCAAAGGTAIGCNDDSCNSFQSEADVAVVAGQLYTIQIGLYPFSTVGGTGTFDIFQLPPAPSNDSCATPQTLIGIGPFPFDNTYATTGTQGQAEALCNLVGGTAVNKDLWYTWTATYTGTADVRTCAQTTVDTKIAVYSGPGCPVSGTSIACNDDSCSTLQSEAIFPCTIGQVYTFQLGLYQGTTQGGVGTFDIFTPPPPPTNDDCSTPIALAGPGTYPFDTTSASTGTQGQAEGACLFFGSTAINNDLWYTYQATTNGTATVTTCGLTTTLSGDSKIAVYAGAGCPATAAVGCNDDDAACGTLNSTVTWTTVCGTTYTIQIGRYPGAGAVGGSFTVSEVGSTCVSGVGFCFGDGTGTACPCANNGVAGNGCANSLVAAGANLASTGSPSVASDTVVLTGTGMPNSSALYFQGTAQVSAGAGTVFGDGKRCAGGSVIRLGTKANSAGASAYPVGADPKVSVKGLVPVAGATRTYQVWYRNAAAFCTVSTFNLSNGLQIVWTP